MRLIISIKINLIHIQSLHVIFAAYKKSTKDVIRFIEVKYISINHMNRYFIGIFKYMTSCNLYVSLSLKHIFL